MTHSKQSHILYVIVLIVILARHTLYLDEIPILRFTFSALHYAFVFVAIHLLIHNRIKTTLLDWGMVAYGAILFFSSIYNHIAFIDFGPLIGTTIDIFIVWTILRSFFVNKDIFPIKAMILILSSFIYINFVLLLLFPNGLWHLTDFDRNSAYLLGGNYNQMGKAFLLSLLLNTIYTHKTKQLRSNLIISSIVILISLYLVGSKTSMLGISVFLLFAILPSRKLRSIALVTFIAAIMIFQCTIVFSGEEITNQRIVHFVEDVLHKDMTFSDRTNIWYQSVLTIADSPIIGYGMQNKEWYEQEIGSMMPHNYVLSVLMRGGFVLLICAILNILLAYRQYRKHKTFSHQIIYITLWVFLFMMLVEVYSFLIMSIMFICLSYIHLLEPNEEPTTL